MPKALEVWAPDPDALAHAVLLEDWKQSATPCPVLCGCGIMPNLSIAYLFFC